jgi:AcrR family transcriptional regulator
MATRTRLATDRRRAQLTEVGLRLFGSRPYDDVSMDDVAKEAGVSHGLVYHYFPDKRSLYFAVIRWVAAQMLDAIAPDPTKSPMERLYDGLRAHLAFAEEYPAGYAALMSGGNGNDEEVRAFCEDARWRGLEEIVRTMGVEQPSPALRVALRGWAGFQEGAMVEWLKRRDLGRDELLDLLASTLGEALRLAGSATADSPGTRKE